MTIKDLVNLCGEDDNDLKDMLSNFKDSSIIMYDDKWDFETDWVEVDIEGYYDDDGNEIDINWDTTIEYLDEDGEKWSETIDGAMNAFHGVWLGEYRIFIDDVFEIIYVFKANMLCDGVVEGFFDFDSFEMINGELERTGKMIIN